MRVDLASVLGSSRLCCFCVAAALLGCSAPASRVIHARRAAAAISERLVSRPLPTQRRRFGEPATYVDGELRGVLRRAELAPGLRPRKKKLLDGRQVERFAVVDYLDSLGIDASRVTALHFHGGRGRVAIVDGALFRRYQGALSFSFTQGHRGKVALELPDDDGFRINTSVDLVQALAVYVDRPAPVLDRERRALALDGRPLEGLAYVPAEELRGTRVYVDGRLVGALKRKALADELLVSPALEGDPARFSLERWLASLGAPVAGVRAVEVLVGDDRVARLDAHRWRSGASKLTFTIPRRSQGRLLLELPAGAAELSGAPRASTSAETMRASAILLYVRRPPAGVPLDLLPEEPDEPGATRPASAFGEAAGEQE
jgi:hypothetical protein